MKTVLEACTERFRVNSYLYYGEKVRQALMLTRGPVEFRLGWIGSKLILISPVPYAQQVLKKGGSSGECKDVNFLLLNVWVRLMFPIAASDLFVLFLSSPVNFLMTDGSPTNIVGQNSAVKRAYVLRVGGTVYSWRISLRLAHISKGEVRFSFYVTPFGGVLSPS